MAAGGWHVLACCTAREGGREARARLRDGAWREGREGSIMASAQRQACWEGWRGSRGRHATRRPGEHVEVGLVRLTGPRCSDGPCSVSVAALPRRWLYSCTCGTGRMRHGAPCRVRDVELVRTSYRHRVIRGWHIQERCIWGGSDLRPFSSLWSRHIIYVQCRALERGVQGWVDHRALLFVPDSLSQCR